MDDNESVRADFTRLLTRPKGTSEKLDELSAMLFTDTPPDSTTSSSNSSGSPATPGDPSRASYAVDCASQGQQALQMLQRTTADGDRYAMAFVDMRMPPGWDGVTTTKKLWEVDPELEVVVCSAYADYDWSEIARQLGHSENLLFLRKPFDGREVVQFVHALTTRWLRRLECHRTIEELQTRLARCDAELRTLRARPGS